MLTCAIGHCLTFMARQAWVCCYGHKEKSVLANLMIIALFALTVETPNRPFSYSEKESQSNDILLHFVEIFECAQ